MTWTFRSSLCADSIKQVSYGGCGVSYVGEHLPHAGGKRQSYRQSNGGSW